MSNKNWFLYSIILLAIFFTGCDSEDPDPVNEQELITRVTLTLTPQGGGTAVVAIADDPDGDGVGLTIETIELVANTVYDGIIEIEDAVNQEDITAEVEEESDVHQFWYTAGGNAAGRLTVTITDTDANGLPVGLAFTVAATAGTAVAGTLNVVLSHYDEAPKDGTTRSDETDVDITFPVNIASSL